MTSSHKILALVLGVGLGSGGCSSDLPYHCANNEGDKTCKEYYRAEFCDSCRLENGGCTDKLPTIICEYPGEKEFALAGSYSGEFMAGCEGQEPGEFMFEVTVEGEINGERAPDDEQLGGYVDPGGNVHGVIDGPDVCIFEGVIDEEKDARGTWHCSDECEGEWVGMSG